MPVIVEPHEAEQCFVPVATLLRQRAEFLQEHGIVLQGLVQAAGIERQVIPRFHVEQLLHQNGPQGTSIRLAIAAHVRVPITVGLFHHHVRQAAHEPDAEESVPTCDIHNIILAKAPDPLKVNGALLTGIRLPMERASRLSYVPDSQPLCIV